MCGRDGGTQMYCPGCKRVRVCSAVAPRDVDPTVGAGQRWYMRTHDDLQFFRRGRECQTCFRSWLSVEIPESHLGELVQLREVLADLKEHAETYVEQAKSASATLKKLNNSMGVLRALQIYKDA